MGGKRNGLDKRSVKTQHALVRIQPLNLKSNVALIYVIFNVWGP